MYKVCNRLQFAVPRLLDTEKTVVPQYRLQIKKPDWNGEAGLFILLCLLCRRGLKLKKKMSHSMTKQANCPCAQRKTQISLRICPVWSEYLLCCLSLAKAPRFLHADSKDADQIGRMPRLIWVFAGLTCHFVCFVVRRLINVTKMKRSPGNGTIKDPMRPSPSSKKKSRKVGNHKMWIHKQTASKETNSPFLFWDDYNASKNKNYRNLPKFSDR